MRLLVLLLLAGCASVSDPWHDRELDDSWRSETLDTGATMEWDLGGRRGGETIAWDWFVMQRLAVDFDLHVHSPSGVRTLIQLQAVEDTRSVTAQEEGTYFFQFHNPQDTPVEVLVQTDGPVVVRRA